MRRPPQKCVFSSGRSSSSKHRDCASFGSRAFSDSPFGVFLNSFRASWLESVAVLHLLHTVAFNALVRESVLRVLKKRAFEVSCSIRKVYFPRAEWCKNSGHSFSGSV